MKCPKCGYNSFEYLAACKKCSADLSSYKDSLGIRPVILPAFAPAAAALLPEEEPAPAPAAAAEMFSWDAPAESAPAAEPLPFTAVAAPPEPAPADAFAFSFDDLPAANAPAPAAAPAPSAWDAPVAPAADTTSFAGLLESIDREEPAPELPDAFSFDGLEGFETVDVAAPAAPAHDETAAAAPGGLDDLDKLFSEEEKAD